MLLLITYDVSTETSAGRRRLRRVARVCLDYGQRVQKSVFECKVDDVARVRLEQRLLEEIDQSDDSLRIYQLHEPVERYIKEYGKFRSTDFDSPLIV